MTENQGWFTRLMEWEMTGKPSKISNTGKNLKEKTDKEELEELKKKVKTNRVLLN